MKAVEFTDTEVGIVTEALRAYRMETERYIRGAVYEPCTPDCEHCEPKVAHFASIQRNLKEREQVIYDAMAKVEIP